MPDTIMVVEDDEELNDLLHYNLTRAGYDVIQAWDGVEAMQKMRDRRPDLLLLDLMMPGADGWDVCRHVTEMPRLRNVPIIVFTARSAPEDFHEARKFNLAGYFVKPYATADVLRHVEKVLGDEQARAA